MGGIRTPPSLAKLAAMIKRGAKPGSFPRAPDVEEPREDLFELIAIRRRIRELASPTGPVGVVRHTV